MSMTNYNREEFFNTKTQLRWYFCVLRNWLKIATKWIVDKIECSLNIVTMKLSFFSPLFPFHFECDHVSHVLSHLHGTKTSREQGKKRDALSSKLNNNDFFLFIYKERRENDNPPLFYFLFSFRLAFKCLQTSVLPFD